MSDKRLNRYDQRQGCTDIVEMDDGDYCLYDDVVELVDEIDRLRADLAAERKFRDHIQAHLIVTRS